MKVNDIIKVATEFGTFRSREHFLAFASKCLFYIIPAVVLGNFTDSVVQRIKDNYPVVDYVLFYILLQTFIIISTLYLIVKLLTGYASEFQLTLSGSFFVVLYFGMQTNYINMIKEYSNNFI
jgi:hypothetical protein